jgi:hypothetical protein
MVVDIYNPRTQEAKAGEFRGQSGLHSETPPKKEYKDGEEEEERRRKRRSHLGKK